MAPLKLVLILHACHFWLKRSRGKKGCEIAPETTRRNNGSNRVAFSGFETRTEHGSLPVSRLILKLIFMARLTGVDIRKAVILKTVCNTGPASGNFVTCKKMKLALYEPRICSVSSPISNTIAANVETHRLENEETKAKKMLFCEKNQ